MEVLPAAAPEPLRDVVRRGTGRVAGVHSGGVYVLLDDEDVLVLEPADGVGLPCAVRLGTDAAGTALRGVRRGDRVRLHDGVIAVGGRSVRVTRWEAARRPRAGLAPGRVAALVAALAAYDAPVPVDLPVAELVGRGPGLTPAGDDVVAGLLVGLHHHPRLRAPVVAEVNRVLHRTGGLSAALLRSAVDGRHVPALLRLADHVAGHGAEGDLEGLLGALVRVGHSSGTALATGLARAGRSTAQAAA
jgi:hypothetical protein